MIGAGDELASASFMVLLCTCRWPSDPAFYLLPHLTGGTRKRRIISQPSVNKFRIQKRMRNCLHLKNKENYQKRTAQRNSSLPLKRNSILKGDLVRGKDF